MPSKDASDAKTAPDVDALIERLSGKPPADARQAHAQQGELIDALLAVEETLQKAQDDHARLSELLREVNAKIMGVAAPAIAVAQRPSQTADLSIEPQLVLETLRKIGKAAKATQIGEQIKKDHPEVAPAKTDITKAVSRALSALYADGKVRLNDKNESSPFRHYVPV